MKTVVAFYSKVDSNETYYRYDGTSNHVLFEENAKGEITKAYTYDDNGQPLTMTYGDETYYYLTNYRGDVLALTDESGEVVAEYTYDAWGNILTQKDLDQEEDVNLAKENPYRYAGYRYDEETKLYYLMARYYNPDTGVFLSLDPVRGDTMNPITLNGYNYANNNPVMNVDPDGEHPLLALVYQLIAPILIIFAKRYGQKIMNKHVKNLLVKRIQPIANKIINKRYQVQFFNGTSIFKIIKPGKGRLYAFDYGPIAYKKGSFNSFHYHTNYTKKHYVYKWNNEYRNGYKFKYTTDYKWVNF